LAVEAIQLNDANNIFDRMPWRNPSDNQGMRFLVEDVRVVAWGRQQKSLK
jgi:hypothetical protein